MERIDLTGRKFGRLTVVSYAGNYRTAAQWNCKCDCGAERVVIGNKLRSGHTTSCPCKRRETVKHLNRSHGMCRTPAYRSWQAMKDRCSIPTNNVYHLYGGRGITVCLSWLDSFENFIADMGPIPHKGYTLDRIDPNGNYTKENCRWASKREQGANTRRNRRITFNGETNILAEWLRKFKVTPQHFYGLHRQFGETETMEKLSLRCQ